MAIKKPTADTQEATVTSTPESPSSALMALSGAIKLFDIPAPRVSTDLFPAVKIPYPVELSDKFPANTLFQVGLFDGTSFSPILCPATFSVIAAREATRKLVVDAAGEKNYERAYKGMGTGMDASHGLFEQHLRDPQAERGVSYVVAIVSNGAVALAEIPAFKVMKDFWGPALHQAQVQNGMGATLIRGDVTPCQTACKKDPTKKYLDPKKFNQPNFIRSEQLTPEQAKLIIDAFEQNKSKFDAWMKR